MISNNERIFNHGNQTGTETFEEKDASEKINLNVI